jgi:hypothetical protein
MDINNRTPGVKHRRSRVSDNIGVGIYTWQMPDGNILGDSQGNVLSVASRVGDIGNMSRIREYVEKELGIYEGKPRFLDGASQLTETENDTQVEQMLNGQVPDWDLGSLKDDMKRAKRTR